MLHLGPNQRLPELKLKRGGTLLGSAQRVVRHGTAVGKQERCGMCTGNNG